MPGYPECSRFILDSRKSNFSRRLFLCSILLLFLNYSGYSQRFKIDSLKRVLPSLHDSVLVDCLNTLSLIYSYLEVDTAQSYARRAYNEADKFGYKRGKVMSLNNQAHIAGYTQNNFMVQEKISLETIPIATNLSDTNVISDTYMNLALALFCQGLFDRSAEACNKILDLAGASDNRNLLGEGQAVMGSIRFETGNYEESLDYFNKSLANFSATGDSYNGAIINAKIGDLHGLAGDGKTALDYYFKSLAYPKGASLKWHPLVDLGDTYYSPEPLDTTSFDQDRYIQSIKTLTIRSNNQSLPRIQVAEKHIAARRYSNAIDMLVRDLEVLRTSNHKSLVMRVLLNLGRAYDGKREYQRAFVHTRDLLREAKFHKAEQYVRDGYKLMSIIHHQLNHADSAYYYLRNYTAMKDSVAQDAFVRKLALYRAVAEVEKKQAQIELLKNEKVINEQRLQLTQQQIERESFLRNIVISGALVLLLLGFVIFRNVRLQQKNEANKHEFLKQELNLQRIESDRFRSELQKEAAELEMKALRAQMNPHFIFNSLNSINRFILQSNKLQASEYLTKFSKLVRLILQNSQLTTIPLESELEALYLYLELEALRFDNHFEYRVRIEEGIDCSTMMVPPLIIQPYVENAIWHGMMHKEEKGHLLIELFQQDNLLCCKITDDGVGRKKAENLKSKSASKYKSMGMRITEDRIALLQKENKLESYVSIVDLVLPDGSPGGTEVLLKIPAQV